MISVLLFGKYRELIGCDSVSLPAAPDFSTLAEALLALDSQFSVLLSDKRLLIAVNCELQSREQFSSRDGDEVALMPPVTGG